MGLISAARDEGDLAEDEVAVPAQDEATAEEAMPEAPSEAPPNEQLQGEADSQKWYDRVVTAAISVIHKQGAEAIAQALTKGQRQPAEALAGAASSLVIQVDDKLGGVPEDVVLPAAGEVLGLVAEFADARGIFTANRRQIEQAMVLMLQQLMTHYGVSQEDMKEFMDTTGKEHAQEIARGLHSVAASVAGGAPQGSRGSAPQQAPQQPEMGAPQEAM